MPELPEVETVVRTLETQIADLTIKDVRVLYSRIIDNVSVEEFIDSLKGQSFKVFTRRGKYLIFKLNDYCLIVHLRMEGKFFLIEKDEPLNKHIHIVFELSNGKELRYQDVRKFGRMYLYPINSEYSCLNNLGYEFFDKEMDVNYLANIARNSSMNLKQFLLDQQLILGVGNIYADEICFKMGKHPKFPIKDLTIEDLNLLITSGLEVLSKAIAAGGTTIRSYTSSLGITGRFQQELIVHQRANEPCKVCGTTIIKDRVAGRGTYFCPNCQRIPYYNVALTGPMGSGKSTVLELFAKEGFNIVDCDVIVDKLLQDKQVLSDIKKILKIKFTDDHRTNKRLIADVIFTNSDLKVVYENYLHPLVLKCALHNDSKYNIIEVQRLFQSNLDNHFDASVAVIAPSEIVKQRLIEKGVSELEITRRKQDSNAYFKSRATFVIDNSHDRQFLEKQVKILSKIFKGEKVC